MIIIAYLAGFKPTRAAHHSAGLVPDAKIAGNEPPPKTPRVGDGGRVASLGEQVIDAAALACRRGGRCGVVGIERDSRQGLKHFDRLAGGGQAAYKAAGSHAERAS